MIDKYQELTAKLGYQFQDPELLEAALSHRSARGVNNERLEFLGDSIVNFIIAEILYRKFPSAREGELSRLRASLVKGETLSKLAREFDLGNYLRLGTGEQKSGGHQRHSILADAFEAIVGAIYLDNGIDNCRKLLMKWYRDRLASITLESIQKDPKTQLQEYLQAHKLPLPNYSVESVEGADHEQKFFVQCQVDGVEAVTVGQGSNRRRAEQQAAKLFLQFLLASE